MSTDNLPPPFKFDELTRRPHRRLTELERRVAGFGALVNPVGDSPVEHFHTTAVDLSVPSGSFPAAQPPVSFVPTRDCSFGVGLLRLQAAHDGTGNFDHGCNVAIDRGDGYFLICSVGQVSVVNTGNAFTSDPSGILPYRVEAGHEYLIRHEFYFADSGGLGGSGRFESIFTLVAFPDIN